jgi:hypothetical protein
VVCFGGALSYVCEKRYQAANELIRVTKSGGVLIVSVMSNIGCAIGVVEQGDIPYLKEPGRRGIHFPDMPGLWELLETGDLNGFQSHIGLKHAAMHLYTANELKTLFTGCDILQVAGSCVMLSEYRKTPEEITTGSVWSTVVELERKLCTDPGLVNSGTHIILAARKY